MANILLQRVDNRLIHGQVTANWVRSLAIDSIVLIDDSISEDNFLKKIFRLSVPEGRSLLIYSCDDAVAAWKINQFSEGRSMVVYKNIAGAFNAFQSGLVFEALQIGGVEHAPGRKMVLESIALSQKEAFLLNKLEEKGVEIVFQIVSEHKPVSWNTIRKKSFPDLETMSE